MPAKTIAWLLRWHMRIGMVVSVAIIGWGLSGMAHPILANFNPRPAAMSLPLEDFPTARLRSPVELMEGLELGVVSALRLVNWQRPVYRLESVAGVQWRDAITGEEIANGERDYAIMLARHYLGDSDSAVISVSRQHHFDGEYVFINRLLPVWKVVFQRDDGARVYVDTESGRLAAIVNDNKAQATAFFRNVHSWVFIRNEALRHGLMLLFLAGGALVGIAGIVQYSLMRRRGRSGREGRSTPMKNWHRRLGIVVSLSVVTFTVSGSWHLLQKHNGAQVVGVEPWAFPLASMQLDWLQTGASVTQAELVSVGGQPYFRVWADRTLRYVHAGTGAELEGGEERHALELAAAYAGEPADAFAAEVVGVRTVNEFGGEYGFVNKRLPVIAVDRSDPAATSYYVEPRSGALAAVVRNSDRAEGWSFAWLHKWHFLDGLGKTTRDTVAAVFALGIALTFALGVALYGRRISRRRGQARNG